MAQTGFTPIQLYSTSTAAAAPVAGNLTNSTLGSELAINITDGKLFYKDNANAVQVIGWKTVPTTAGGTGLTTYTAGDLSYYATGTTFTKLAIGTAGQILSSTGSAPQWTTLSGVAVTTFSAGTTGFTPNSATSGAITLAGTLITSNGGTGLSSYTAGDLSYYASGTALTKLAIGASTTILTSTGSAPQWSATSGITVGTATNLAGGVAGSVPYQTGAGATTFLGIGASGRFLSSTGSAPQWSAPAALTEVDDTNVTMTLGGTPSTALLNSVSMTLGWTGTLAVSRGGTGTGTAFTTGSVIFAGASGVYSQDNGQLFWDNPNDRLGIGTSTPTQKLDVNGVGRFGSLATKINVGLNGDSISSDGDLYVQTSASKFVSIRANFTEGIRVHPSGGVSIGSTSDPSATNLFVAGRFNAGINGTSFPSATAKGIFYTTTAETGVFINVDAASSNANSGLAIRKRENDNTTAQIYVDFQFNQGLSGSGGIQGNGASGVQFYSSSDARLKENVVELDSQLDKILQLQPKIFDFIDGAKNCTGFIAQEFKTVYPDAVGEQPDGYLTIGGVSIMETRLIKALQEIVAKLKAAGVEGF
jgi:hypothetical protein